MSTLQTKQELMSAFEKIIANKEDSYEALSDPSKILIKYGVKVPNPELTNETLFKSLPQLRVHFIDAAKGKPHDLLGCDSPGCLACKASLNTVGVAAITALCLAWPEDMALVPAVAAITGLSDAAIISALTGLSAGGAIGVEAAIDALCGAMGAC